MASPGGRRREQERVEGDETPAKEPAVGVCGWSRDGVWLKLLAGSPGVAMGTAGGCSEGSAGSAAAPGTAGSSLCWGPAATREAPTRP